jgi:hypothetical protein
MNTPSLSQIAHALGHAKKSGSGLVCSCPCHDDQHASLSITERDGKLLFKCYAGCGNAILPMSFRRRGWLNGADPEKEPKRRIVATFPYVDEAGELLYEVVRYEPKSFLQRRPDGKGGWIWKLGDARRVLYRLPELLEDLAVHCRRRAQGRSVAPLEPCGDLQRDGCCYRDGGSQVAPRGPDGGGFGFHIDMAQLYERPDIEATRIVWEHAIEGTAAEIMNAAEGTRWQGDKARPRQAIFASRPGQRRAPAKGRDGSRACRGYFRENAPARRNGRRNRQEQRIKARMAKFSNGNLDHLGHLRSTAKLEDGQI